ncbi:MAG: iron ABC transporter permease [Candidatus Eremiobacteraeota bacterium]|nr:iron ABC transporter permease [Candidatus Eremiobacteraeota bacterium]
MRLAGIALTTLAAAIASLFVGGTRLPAQAVFGVLAHPQLHTDVATIVLQLRLPRICIALAVGAALAISGALLQGMLRNPLVDPSLIGVSSGAAAAIVLALVLGVAAPLIPGVGFVAGIATAVLVASLARRGTGIDVNRLILAGVSLSALFAAFIAAVLTRSRDAGYDSEIISWLAGSLAGRGWHDLAVTAPYALAGLAFALLSVPALNALRLGDARAAAVGVNVDRAQWMILAGSSLLAASAVTLSGTVGFVGLIVPHIARRIVGSDARYVVLASIGLGAAITALADAACRTIVAPAELPIGVLLAFIGVPTFLYLYLHAPGRAA